MENTKYVLNEIRNINNAYNLSLKQIDKLLAEIPVAKVCTPVIGKFSSGKSSLINTLLGYSRKIMKEDITPETSVPVELVYTDATDNVRIYRNDGKHKDITVDEYRSTELDASNITKARISIRNRFLETIPDVMIVDMPGFESGYEIHNRAIDEYLPQSLAYIVAFPADDMIVRSSVGNILRELMLNDMPICVVITKSDKMNDEFDVSLENLKENLKRYIGNKKVRFCITSSLDGTVDEVIEFFADIQEESQNILARKFRNNLLTVLDNTETYLKTTLKSKEMSASELDEEEERLGKQLAGLNYKFSSEREEFELKIEETIEEIKSDVQYALETEENTLVTMTLNNQKINDHLNSVVRNAVTTSVNKRFIPKVEKYLKRVEKCINDECIEDVQVSFDFDAKELGNGFTAATLATVTGLVIGLPIFGTIIMMGIAYFIGKSSEEKKRETIKNEVKTKLRNEVYPQIMKQVGNGLEIAITKQMKLINTSIEDEIIYQKETLEKAVADVRSRMNDEKQEKENLAKDINNDLAKIEELRELIA